MATSKILVFGHGFIGRRIQEYFCCRLSGKRIANLADVQAEIDRYRPAVIINCIGYTGARNVDDCEADKDAALFANTYIPVIMAEAAVRNKIRLVHISSGCIYHYDYARDTPLTETRLPDFFDLYYSRSKIYAERALDILTDRYDILIARIRIPLDDRPHPRGILNKLLSFKQVIDSVNSITYIPDFLAALHHLIKIEARGVYNVVNKGGLRYAELLDVYKKYVPDFSYTEIPHTKLNLVRTNLLLSTRKLERTGFKVRRIHDVLDECVRNHLKLSGKKSS